tara:strand:- start:82396 stop:82989 length:594 start_codon:yes stop_codon:yes gene_type:complete
MAQDIRDLLKNDPTAQKASMSKGHKARFMERLDDEFPQKKSGSLFIFLRIAAIGLIFISLGLLWFQNTTPPEPAVVTNTNDTEDVTKSENQFTLGDISPEFKKIENYYLTGINMKLAGLKVTDENKEFLEAYMERLQVLDEEYNALNTELNTLGPNEQTITALIENLKLRLDLLIKLNNKLHQFKQSENEQINQQQA